jgi:hypothetical protein
MASNSEYQNRPVWLLCEGSDCCHFFKMVLAELEMTNICCRNVEGINDKDLFRGIPLAPDYINTKVIVYVRDSEFPKDECRETLETTHFHFDSVIQSIQSRFASIDLSVGDKPLVLYENNGKKVAYIILTDSKGDVGTLEDLLLDIAVDTEAVDDAVSTVKWVNEKRNGKAEKDIHKRKLNIAFALNAKREMVGAKTGQAVKYRGLDLDHERFKPIREFLATINEQACHR